MAGKRQRENGSWEYRFTRKGVLPKPYYTTFDTEAEGDAYAARVEPLLQHGILPPEMAGGEISTMSDLLSLFDSLTELSQSDKDLLPTASRQLFDVSMNKLTYDWVENWVAEMKAAGMAPSTLKKRVGILARAVDWGMRREKLSLVTNPLRLLPKGYASKGVEKELLWAGERDRRLSETEEGAIRKVLVKKEEHLLFDMALESAMRMREMYTLEKRQIDLAQRTIFLEKTKNGSKRQVPISTVLLEILKPVVAVKERDQLLFSFWDGVENVKACTNRLSHLFQSRFSKAKVDNLHFHDLRHEATSRIYERTNLTDLEVAKITGHKDLRMLSRYANLRGSTLAARLW